MKLVGKLKEDIEKATDMAEVKTILENAGLELTEDELTQIAGGMSQSRPAACPGLHQTHGIRICKVCGRRYAADKPGDTACDRCGNSDPNLYERIDIPDQNPRNWIFY